jgi:mitogen-activated protein kinase kinase
MLVCSLGAYCLSVAQLTRCSLEKEPPRRATPWRMLEHPWMLEMKTKKVNMGHFLKQVWDWKD